ncbi:MAG: hypothetical protein M1521_04365 [Thermotogae bacterium]|nr:hypothetical protein [Thermotogota bacterium]
MKVTCEMVENSGMNVDQLVDLLMKNASAELTTFLRFWLNGKMCCKRIYPYFQFNALLSKNSPTFISGGSMSLNVFIITFMTFIAFTIHKE